MPQTMQWLLVIYTSWILFNQCDMMPRVLWLMNCLYALLLSVSLYAFLKWLEKP